MIQAFGYGVKRRGEPWGGGKYWPIEAGGAPNELNMTESDEFTNDLPMFLL